MEKDIIKSLDLSELEKLSETEKTLVLKILAEYSEKGKSDAYTQMLLEDFNEIPVDILTFVDDYNYLGNAWHDNEGKSKLYPYWREELVKIFPDNLTTAVNNGIFSGSRGRGKTEICTLIAAYMLHRILCLKDPIAYYHLKPTEKIVFAFMNIKLALVEEIVTAKFQNTIQTSPWFMSRGTVEGRTKRIWVPKKFNDQEAIDIKMGSQADDLLGLPIFFAFFDEISFIRNQDIEKQKEKAYKMIDTAIGGMKTRFIYQGKNPTFLALASSRRSDKSFLEEHMKKKLISEKDNVYISTGSVWEVKPKGTYSEETFNVGLGHKFLQSLVIPDSEDVDTYVKRGYKIIRVPEDFRADFLDDIDKALCDFAGISSSSITKYIKGQSVNELITTRIKNPFVKEILEIGNAPDDDAQYYNFFDLDKIDPSLRSKPLFIHLDMSVTGDLTGIAGVFIRGKKTSVSELEQSKDLFFSLAFSVSIKAPKGRQVSFEKNRNFIYWLKSRGLNIRGVTSDTYQSYDTGQQLLAKGYPYTVLSVDRVDPSSHVCRPYQYFKTTIDEKRLEIYEDKMLIYEITELERNIDTGKVDHPNGGCFTGDTKVKLVDGRSLSFLELVDEHNNNKTNYVYSMNLETNKIEAKPILKAWKTLENQPLVKLTFDNREAVECTLNHRFMLRDGSYIRAQDLLPGDSLMPLYTKYPSKGGLSKYRLYYEPFEDKWHFEHRTFAKEILDEKHLVHHRDCNPNNNSPENLIWCSKTQHQKIHAEMQTGACSEEAIEKKSRMFGFEYESIEPRKKGPWNNRYRQKLYDLKNHKVVSIEFIDKCEDVYDIEVADNHNFALAAGIFVHNSKDVCDAVCGAVYNASSHAEEFAYDYGESAEEMLRLNEGGSYLSDREQIALDMENELKRLSPSPRPTHPSNIIEKRTDYNLYSDIIIL